MKNFIVLFIAAITTLSACGQQDKSKRPSPPAMAKEKIASGATVSIDYSQPSIKGRTIGKDIEPMTGKVWRTGANEATVFETDKDITVEGKALPAGKYGLFSIMNEDGSWTIIFNKTWKQWGAFNYKEADDALRVNVKGGKGDFAEKFAFTIAKSGKVSFMWGDKMVSFMVK